MKSLTNIEVLQSTKYLETHYLRSFINGVWGKEKVKRKFNKVYLN